MQSIEETIQNKTMRNYRELSDAEIEELERLYPVTTNRELSKIFDISIDAIQDRFASPRGWKKDYKAVCLGNRGGRSLTEREVKWICNHYHNSKNRDILDKFGIGESTLHRVARQFGLKKTRNFIKKTQAEAKAKAVETVRIYDLMPKGMEQCPWLVGKGHFSKGVSNLKRLGRKKERERLVKAHEKRNRSIASERRRIKYGMERKLKMRLSEDPALGRKQSQVRYYMKRIGYEIEKGSLEIYYNESTVRHKDYEKKAENRGFYVRPIEQKGTPLYDDVAERCYFERHID